MYVLLNFPSLWVQLISCHSSPTISDLLFKVILQFLRNQCHRVACAFCVVSFSGSTNLTFWSSGWTRFFFLFCNKTLRSAYSEATYATDYVTVGWRHLKVKHDDQSRFQSFDTHRQEKSSWFSNLWLLAVCSSFIMSMMSMQIATKESKSHEIIWIFAPKTKFWIFARKRIH